MRSQKVFCWLQPSRNLSSAQPEEQLQLFALFCQFCQLGQVNALEVPYFTNTFTQLQNLGGIMKRYIKLTTSHFFKFRDVYARMGSISAMKIYFLQQKIREVIKKMEWNMTRMILKTQFISLSEKWLFHAFYASAIPLSDRFVTEQQRQ